MFKIGGSNLRSKKAFGNDKIMASFPHIFVADWSRAVFLMLLAFSGSVETLQMAIWRIREELLYIWPNYNISST